MNTVPQPALEAISGEDIQSFFAGLLPSFEKRRITEELSTLYKELQAIKDLYAVIGSEYNNVMQSTFKPLIRAMDKNVEGFRGDAITHLSTIIKERLSEKSDLEDFVDEIYGPVVIKDAMDYRKVNMLRFIDGFNFFNTYARKLLLVATDTLVDQGKLDNNIRTASSVVSKLDREYVMDPANIRGFSLSTNAMGYSIKDIRKLFAALKKVSFNPDTHSAVVAQNGSKADPLRMGLMPVVGSLVYFVGMNYNLYLVKRQELLREEVEKLQLKVLMIRRLNDGTMDKDELSKVDKQVAYYDNRINKLSAKLEDLQED